MSEGRDRVRDDAQLVAMRAAAAAELAQLGPAEVDLRQYLAGVGDSISWLLGERLAPLTRRPVDWSRRTPLAAELNAIRDMREGIGYCEVEYHYSEGVLAAIRWSAISHQRLSPLVPNLESAAEIETARRMAEQWRPRAADPEYVDGALVAFDWLLDRRPAPMSRTRRPAVLTLREMREEANRAYEAAPALNSAPRQGWAAGVAHALDWAMGEESRPPVRYEYRRDGPVPTG